MNSSKVTYYGHDFEAIDNNPDLMDQRPTFEANLTRKTPYIIPAGRITAGTYLKSPPNDPPLDLMVEIQSRQELSRPIRIIAHGTAFDFNIARPKLFAGSITDLRISWYRSEKGRIWFSGEPEVLTGQSVKRYQYSLSSEEITATRYDRVSGKPLKQRILPPSGLISTINIHLLCDLLSEGEGSVRLEFIFGEESFKETLTADISFLVRRREITQAT